MADLLIDAMRFVSDFGVVNPTVTCRLNQPNIIQPMRESMLSTIQNYHTSRNEIITQDFDPYFENLNLLNNF